MKYRTMMIAAVLAVALLPACTGTKNSTDNEETGAMKVAVPKDSLDEALDRIDPELVVTAGGSSEFTFGLLTGGGGPPEGEQMGALRGIRSVTFQVFAPDGRLIGTETTDEIISSGVMSGESGEASITISANVVWKAPEPPAPGSYVVMTVHTAHGMVVRRRNLIIGDGSEKRSGRALNMWLESRDMGVGVEFILHVERIAPSPDGEYLPSGEQYRIEIESDVGETLWSSSEGMAFIQSIGEVHPLQVGETVEYRAIFDGRNELTRTQLAPGRYRIVATIPAKPIPYILREEFTWSGR